VADTIASLEIALGLVGLSAVTGGLREVSGALGLAADGASTLNRAQMAGGLLASGAALTGLAAGIGAVAAAGIGFQDMLITTQNNTTMTTADVAALSAGVLQLARDAGVGTDVLANGFMRAMNISGDTAASMAILRVATESAVSTGGNAAATTNVLANAMHEYGLDVVRAADGTLDLAAVQENAARTMGQLHYAAALGNATLEEFASSSGRAIGTAANLGIPLADVAAALSSLTKHGYDAAQSQTQVVALMTHLINPTVAARKELAALSAQSGINLTADFSAEGLRTKGIVGVVDDVRTAFRKLGYDESQATAEAMKLVAAQRGGLGLASLIGTGYADYKTDIADLNDQTKIMTVTDEAFARTQGTVANQLARLQQTMPTTVDVVGQAMLPQLGRLLGFITPLVDGVAAWVRAHAAVIAPILGTVAAVAALVGAAATLGGTLMFLRFGLQGFGTLLAPVGAGLLAAVPWFLAAAAAGALLGLVWRTNFLGIRTLVTDVAGVVRTGLGALSTAFHTGDFNAAFGTIITAIDTVFGRDVAGALTLGLSNGLRVAQLFRDTVLTVREVLGGTWVSGSAIDPFVNSIGRAIEIVQAVAQTAREAASGDWFGGQTEDIPLPIRALGRGLQLARDSIITIRQALAGEWVPAAGIQPFVLAVGAAVLWGQRLVGWARAELPVLRDYARAAFGTLSDIVEARVLPVLSRLRDFYDGTLLPAFTRLADFVRANLAPALGFLADHWAALSAGGSVVAIVAGLVRTRRAAAGRLRGRQAARHRLGERLGRYPRDRRRRGGRGRRVHQRDDHPGGRAAARYRHGTRELRWLRHLPRPADR